MGALGAFNTGWPAGSRKVVDDRTLERTALVTVRGYKAKLERIFRVRLDAFDWNCPQHITPRFTDEQVTEAVRPLWKGWRRCRRR